VTGSLAYRKNEAAILRGEVPEKYTRILPFIAGNRIIEAGSAEGVLACLLAKQGRAVTAIEANLDRHAAAISLSRRWGVEAEFLNARIEDSLDRLSNADCFLAVRAIYYWGAHLDTVFAAVAESVPTVVLCGNRNRADAWREGRPHAPLGEMNRYAALEGMKDVLARHGYRITEEVTDGDEIVVGVLG
jgi:SAM-dependent methyltransferase